MATVEGGESEETGTKRSSQDPTTEAPPAKRGRGRGRPKKADGGETSKGAASKQKRKPKKGM